MTSSIARRPDDLPDFDRPPVEEVVLSVGFEPVEELGLVQEGLLWDRKFRDRFPHVEEQPPWELPIERFGVGTAGPTFSFRALRTPPLPRLWFEDAERAELVQVQPNWFARNWRKMRPSAEYPYFDSLLPRFLEDFGSFREFLRELGASGPIPVQCEITYVNHIEGEGVWTSHGELPKVTSLASTPPGDFLPAPELMTLSSQYVIPDADDSPIGRLYVSAQPGFRSENGTPIFILTLTARGAPRPPDDDGVVAFLRMGRRWIDKAFGEVTTRAMQDAWGRRNGN